MSKVNSYGYIERTRTRELNGRNWWLVKATASGSGYITLNHSGVSFPSWYIGKRIRIKVEVIDDTEK